VEREVVMLAECYANRCVAETANRVYVMYAGKIVEEGVCETIFYGSATPIRNYFLELFQIH